MTNRWKINRMGFINFWLYDEEIFSFSDGKLFLRGANASGKSITTQSFIPFILDGDRTPSRLDPFGSSDRRMEYYFLGSGEKDDETGYLFLEFKKGDSEQYRTIGIGQRAQRGKPMDFWGFIILDGKRVGCDANLYKEVGSKKIPYTKQELKKELGENNLVVDKQKEYMELVNKRIFGFPRIEQYDQFIRLMIKVRAPKLSRDFKPTKVYDILNESLQTLSDEDLRAMIDAMEKMDDIQNKLDNLEEAFKDAQSIRNEYGHYNQYMLAKKASAYISVKKQVDAANSKRDAYECEIRDATGEKDSKESENEKLNAEMDMLEKEKELLNASDLESYVENLRRSKTHKADLENETVGLVERIESHRQKIRKYDADDKDFKKDIDSYQWEIDKTLQNLESINETLIFGRHKSIGEAVRQGAVRTVFIGIANELKMLAEGISKGIKAIQKLSKIEETWNKLEEEFSKLCLNKNIAEEHVKIAEEIETQCRDSIVEAFHIIAGKHKELIIGKQELSAIVSLIIKYESAKDVGEIKKIIDTLKGSKERILLENRAKYKAKYAELDGKYKQTQQELEALKNKNDPAPERREKVTKARTILAERGIICAPLYELMEFDKQLSEEERALLEEQLGDASLLDALIVAKKDYKNARAELAGLSDSLIQADLNVHTGYRKLMPADVTPELREAVASVIDNIYDKDEEGALIVLSADGYYRNGAVEGHSISEGQASFVGAIARRNKLARMIVEKEAECDRYREQMDECDEIINSIQASIDILDSEYKSIPSFTDIDQAIDILKDVNYELKRAAEECVRKENELSEALGIKKKCEQEVITNCRDLPYERTLLAYEEASDAIEDYRGDLLELEKEVNYLDTAKSKSQNIKVLIDKEEDAIDIADLQLKKTEQSIRVCTSEIGQLEAFLNRPDNKDRAEKLKRTKEKLSEIRATVMTNIGSISSLEANIKNANNAISLLREEIINGIEKENKVRAYFQEELALKLVLEQGGRALLECANEALGCIRENDKNKSVADVVSSLHKVYQQHSSNLTNYGTSLEDCFEDDANEPDMLRKRQRIVSTWQGKKLYLQEFYLILKEAIDSTQLMIQEKDRALFEDVLANTISTKLNNRISESRAWINDMSKLMQTMDTSMGLTFSLDWKPRSSEGEKELDTKELEKLLSRDKELLMQEDRDRVSAHFRSKIRLAKQIAEENGDVVNYADMVRDALDYRKWFEFRMFFYRNGEAKKELTNSAFNKFSGGEKAMAMYVPLFAAVNAQYKKADNHDHPRIIALDEAFAGVDDKNINSMFELVQKLDFDYIMNSQALWGCYESVRSLKIAELLRPANSDVVTVIYYYWNGKVKILENQ